MEEYATDIQKMKLPSGNTKDMDQTISKEMFQMTFNPIGWQDRVAVNLSYGISHVQQQLATKEGRAALEWLNKIVYRAKELAVQIVEKLKDWRNYIVVPAKVDWWCASPTRAWTVRPT